ncbi:Purine-cytosine permease [Amycolatopsis pretoriensis]|uniref:Purine-cytosine permease n=1 Tax=Amycolatopsis pretoriensis TaxID=218821 RepID=A0A1H5R2M6_9PSEU|nr:cytosine permease [Amycolatopsis pretoriensis]SEF32304.1 Purine-cytosine permease [Amycolatopsis pretoriensis]
MSVDQRSTEAAARGDDPQGVEYVPDAARLLRPRNIATTMVGANLLFGVIVIGWLPVTFGLDWWGAFSSIVLGVLVGAALLGPIAAIGPRTGTNGPVSSGAFFGVIGRVIGTLLALFIAIGFYALAVWSGGQVIVYGLHALWGLPDSKVTLAISYVVMAAVATWTAVSGYRLVVRLNKWLIPTAGAVIVLGFLVFAGDFHTTAVAPEYLLGSFWPTWSLAVSIATATTIGYAPYLNDGTRLISRRFGGRSVGLATALGLFIGLVVPLTFGAYTSYAINSPEADYVEGLVKASPTWFLVPIVLVGFFGCLGQSAICVYGNGLDLSSVIRPLRRVPATLVVSAVSLVFILVGALVWDIEHTVSAFLTVLGVVAAAWVGIVLTGHFLVRGEYDTAALQVFNEGRTGGRYWFFHGWNLRATAAFALAAVVGLLQANTSLYTGPWSEIADGVDLSWLSAMVVGGAVYGLLTKFLPGAESVTVPAEVEADAALS